MEAIKLWWMFESINDDVLRTGSLTLHILRMNMVCLILMKRQLAKIKNILTEKFVEHQYHIMDTDFNNAILFLNIMICRMGDGFYVQSNELDITENLGKEYEMSKDIFEKIGRRFLLKSQMKRSNILHCI